MNVEGSKKRKRAPTAWTKRYKPSLAKRVKKLEKAVEKKYFDYALKATESTGGYTHTGRVIQINAIPQGDGERERIGQKVFLESVHLRLHATVEETNGLAGLRTILLYDESPEPPGVTGGNFLDFSSVIDGEEYLAPIATRNMENVTVLFDDTNGSSKDSWVQVTTSGSSTALSTRTELTINAYRKIRRPTRFSSEGGGTAHGTLYLVLVGNQWGNSTGDPANRVALTARVKYSDA